MSDIQPVPVLPLQYATTSRPRSMIYPVGILSISLGAVTFATAAFRLWDLLLSRRLGRFSGPSVVSLIQAFVPPLVLSPLLCTAGLLILVRRPIGRTLLLVWAVLGLLFPAIYVLENLAMLVSPANLQSGQYAMLGLISLLVNAFFPAAVALLAWRNVRLQEELNGTATGDGRYETRHGIAALGTIWGTVLVVVYAFALLGVVVLLNSAPVPGFPLSPIRTNPTLTAVVISGPLLALPLSLMLLVSSILALGGSEMAPHLLVRWACAWLTLQLASAIVSYAYIYPALYPSFVAAAPPARMPVSAYTLPNTLSQIGYGYASILFNLAIPILMLVYFSGRTLAPNLTPQSPAYPNQ